jgi:hypothetical protein
MKVREFMAKIEIEMQPGSRAGSAEGDEPGRDVKREGTPVFRVGVRWILPHESPIQLADLSIPARSHRRESLAAIDLFDRRWHHPSLRCWQSYSLPML